MFAVHDNFLNIFLFGRGNGLSPLQYRLITWSNIDLLAVGPQGTNFIKIWNKTPKISSQENAFHNVDCKHNLGEKRRWYYFLLHSSFTILTQFRREPTSQTQNYKMYCLHWRGSQVKYISKQSSDWLNSIQLTGSHRILNLDFFYQSKSKSRALGLDVVEQGRYFLLYLF